MSTKLLKGGTVLEHDASNAVTARRADILITDSTITQIAPDIQPPPGIEVLDVGGKLLTPGFVDTHHHLSNTALKGRDADNTLLEYFAASLVAGSLQSADDVFWTTLAGGLELLDAGTTTVVEHTLTLHTPAHVFATARATAASGVRAFYCYGVNFGIEAVQPVTFSRGPPAWALPTYEQLAGMAPFAGGRVQLGFAFDLLFLPKPMLDPIFATARKHAALLTHHDAQIAMVGGGPSNLEALLEKGLLGGSPARTILSHANNIPLARKPEMDKYGVEISITPTTELGMGMGNPLPVALRVPEWDSHCSLGIDCRTMVSAFLPGQAREMMGAARAHRHTEAWNDGTKWYRSMSSKQQGSEFPTALRAFNMMTVGGARAVGMEDSIGQLKEGYKADIVVWDVSSPGMLAAVETDPVAAVVMNSSIRDVEGVLVDGIVRKWDGNLTDVRLSETAGEAVAAQFDVPVDVSKDTIKWKEVAAKVVQVRAAVAEAEKTAGVVRREQQDQIMAAFHMHGDKKIE